MFDRADRMSVWAFGTGACDLESGYETLASFVTQEITMNKIAVLILSLFTLSIVAAVPAQASNSNAPGVPSFLTYGTNGIAYVYFPTSIRTGTVPSCAQSTGNYYELALNVTTPTGAAMLAGLIAAHEAGEGVWPTGTGDCGVDSATESLLNFHTEN